MDHQPCYRKLTLDDVRELMKKDEPDVEIESLNEEPGSGRGDNYTSMLYRLRLSGKKRLKSGDSAPWETAIIYKILPESKAAREAFKSELLFRNEIVFYNNLWPAFEQLQKDGRKVFTGVAKCYIAKSDLIAMEDLKRKGYVMADRRKGLELSKLKVVLKALAGFHALSLTLKDFRPDFFDHYSNESNADGIRESLFRLEYEDWYRQYYRIAVKNVISMVSKALPADYEYRRNEILTKLKEFLKEGVFFHRMCKLASTPGPLTVFCHGDCWTNNFLFKEQTDDDSVGVYLVDFQLMRVGSLALDLANLLYCCASSEVHKNHMNSLLRLYHSHLMANLETLNPGQKHREPEAMWTLLNEEMRRCSSFGFGLAVDILPISTCDSDHAPDVYGGTGEGIDARQCNTIPPPGGEECARLMTDLVLDLIDKSTM